MDLGLFSLLADTDVGYVLTSVFWCFFVYLFNDERALWIVMFADG